MITLKTLPKVSAQEVFDYVVTHLRTQNAKSLNGAGECRYRGNDGYKCAAGCLIADDEYSLEMEGQTWSSLSLSDIPRDHSFLIKDLQHTHDHCSISYWENKFKEIASQHDLKYTPKESN